MSIHRKERARRENSSRALVITLLAAGLAAAGSCTVFDGVSVPAATGAATSSASSSGADAGGAGNTGSGGGVGSGGSGGGVTGSGGAGGGVGSGGGAGSGGAGGGTPAASITYLSAPDAARVCSFVFTCPLLSASIARSISVPVDTSNYSQCLTWLAAPVPTRPGAAIQQQILECIAAAPDCAQAAACLPVEAIDPADAICASGSKCADASTAVDCSAAATYHCATAGFVGSSQCQKTGTTSACIKGTCNTQGSTACNNDTLETCTEAGLVHRDCDVAGFACAGSPAACHGEGACPTPGASSCAANAALVCGDGELSAFDCAAIGADCVQDAQGYARCEPPAPACTPSSAGANKCSANKKAIDGCVGGQIVQVSCPAGTTCKGAAGGTSAFCG